MIQGTQPNDCGMCVYLMSGKQQESPVNSGTFLLAMSDMLQTAELYTRNGWIGQLFLPAWCGITLFGSFHS